VGTELGEGGIGSVIAKEFGLGVLANILKNMGLSGLAASQLGASAGDFARSIPGITASGVVGAVQGPLGVGLEMAGLPGYVAGPVGAANTIGGLAGTMAASDIGLEREMEGLKGYLDTDQLPESVVAGAQRAAAPPRGTGLLGLLNEGLISTLGDATSLYEYHSPVEQAQVESLREASRFKHKGTPYGLYKDPEEETPGMIDEALGFLGGAFGSREEAERKGFKYKKDPKSGQISIDPPHMFGPGGYYDRGGGGSGGDLGAGSGGYGRDAGIGGGYGF
jgi:hypothetical protein